MRYSELAYLKLTKAEEEILADILKERSHRQEERSILLSNEQEPLLLDLMKAGYAVRSVWDFVNTDDDYPAAIPILVAHLKKDYSFKLVGGIARALAVCADNVADRWDALLYQLERSVVALGSADEGLKSEAEGALQGIGVALGAALTPDTIAAAERIADDNRYGSAAILLKDAIRTHRKAARKRSKQQPE